MSDLTVISARPGCTIQDLGRPGYGHLGVACSGAADRASLRLANRLVGNPEDLAGIEVVLGGLELRFHTPVPFVLAGAPAPGWLGRGSEVGLHRATLARPGDTLVLGVPATGLRTYVALAGGIDVPAVLGSRATDSLGGLGPRALTTGRALDLGPRQSAAPSVDVVPVETAGQTLSVRVDRGPRDDMFTAEAWARLTQEAYTVSADASRAGVKLQGPSLARADHREMRSEGMVPGAIQVPPSGQPIVLGVDGPPTGGYPVIGVVRSADLDRLAQLRPGAEVRFRDVGP